MNNETFFEKLREISSSDLTGYLENKGWVKDGGIGRKAIIWHRSEEQYFDFEVLQPVDHTVRGYLQKLTEAIDVIALFEKRSALLVFKEVSNFSVDLVTIRVIHHDVEGGSIPLEDGVLLIEKSKELLVASTLSTFKKKKYFLGSRSGNVQEFISQMRLGQTEVGSFVVNLMSPITFFGDNQEDADKTSLTRSVTTNLAKSLNAISAAIEEYSADESLLHFDGAISDGVSANLCDALVGLSGSSEERSFEISIQLAGVEEDNQSLSIKHFFEPKQLPFIKQASEYYKGNFVLKNFTVFGLVTNMKHINGDDFGELTVSANVHDSMKSVKFQLGLDNYWMGVHAHESRSYVSCIGDLIVTPRSATLADPSEFSVKINKELF
jgi:hypothetical protein